MFEELKLPKSTTFVIFGATGDLTHRKILPALYRLYLKKHLPMCFSIVAVARRDKDDKIYQEESRESLKKYGGFSHIEEDFLYQIKYFRNDFSISEGYLELNEYLDQLDKTHCTATKRIFYLATRPEHFKPIVKNIKEHGLLKNKKKQYRVIVEKPFGRDEDSAKKLNRVLRSAFKEEEIFRIDHYLGKETVQNLFALRFANRIFEPVWNSKHIDNIQIVATEDIGVGTRAGYYDTSGAIRDMVQNHLLQVLSLVAMEPPVSFSNEDIKSSKVEVLKRVKKIDPRNVVFGQYESYHNESDVTPDSRTETYASMKLEIDNERWKGTPIYLKTGKKLRRKATEVIIYFKKTDKKVFSHMPNFKENVLVIRLQPDEGIYLRFNIKEPGTDFKIKRVSMDFCHNCIFGTNTPEAYENLLHHSLLDDLSLFTRWDEVDTAWKIIDPITNYWENSKKKPHIYKSGSWGPEESTQFLEKKGHHWRLRDDFV